MSQTDGNCIFPPSSGIVVRNNRLPSSSAQGKSFALLSAFRRKGRMDNKSILRMVAPQQRRPPSPRPPMLPALDGLRGVAALMIVAHHVLCQIRDVAQNGHIHRSLTRHYEQYSVLSTGVQLFFVLSGFLLFLPYARAMQFSLPFPNTLDFYRRRALRILPAYWASLIIMAFLGDGVTASNLSQHFLLVHNSSSETFYSIGTVFWTLAIEWQFYLILPILAFVLWKLAALHRHLSMCAALMAITAGPYVLGCWVRAVFGVTSSIAYLPACLPVFACGALAAWIYVWRCETRSTHTTHPMKTQADWLGLAGIITAVALTVLTTKGLYVFSRGSPEFWNYGSLLLGCAYALIVFAAASGGRLWHLLLASRPMRYVGMISFSLYMWHNPLLEKATPAITRWSTTWWVLPIAIGLTLAMAIPFSAGFHHLVEKPFLNRKRHKIISVVTPTDDDVTLVSLPFKRHLGKAA